MGRVLGARDHAGPASASALKDEFDNLLTGLEVERGGQGVEQTPQGLVAALWVRQHNNCSFHAVYLRALDRTLGTIARRSHPGFAAKTVAGRAHAVGQA